MKNLIKMSIIVNRISLLQKTHLIRNYTISTNKFKINIEKNSILIPLQDKVFNYINTREKINWKIIREEIIKNERQITELNVDAAIVGCLPHNQIETAKNYIDFLKHENYKINYATIGKLMKLYYFCYKDKQFSSTADQNEILKMYNNIRNEQEIIDPLTCENLIYGLVTTDEWKLSLELLKMTKLICTPSIASYSLIIEKAFENKNSFEIGYDLLQDAINNDRLPRSEVFLQYFQTIQNENRNSFKKYLEKILNFISENKLMFSMPVIEELNRILQARNDFKATIMKFNKQGKCSNCSNSLENVSLTEKDFNKLATVFLNKVLIRKDVFQKSTPYEVETFKKFIEEKGSFDCVIDGLNVAFSCGTKRSPQVFANLLSSVVKHLIAQRKRLLILGRKHMHSWPKSQMNFIQQNATIFFTDNLTHDDPFLLYAALKSGPKTDFVSRDLMRSHAHLLGLQYKDLFKRWQQEHQYQLVTVKNDTEVILKDPIKFNLNAHKVKNVWHIPCRNESQTISIVDSLTIPNSWLCIME